MPYRTHYIVQRGGTLDSLQRRTVAFLQSGKIPPNSFLIVKIALGINDIVKKNKSIGSRAYTLTHEGTQETLNGLIQFRSLIYELKPNSMVSFITVPPIHFSRNVEYQKLNLGVQEDQEFYEDVDVSHIQKNHLDDIVELNRKLIDLNRSQSNIPVTPHCACWHTDIVKTSKKRKRRGGFRTRLYMQQNLLYDGIHAITNLKHAWFEKFHTSVRIDVRSIIRQQRQSESCTY